MSFNTISEMFLQTTEKYADKYLYYFKKQDHWEGLRGRDIRSTVEDLAYALRSLGIKKGVQAAILSNNNPRWAMADYAILATGAATVSIYPTLISSQIAYIINNSESAIIFVENEEQATKILEVWDDCPKLKTMVIMNADKVAGNSGKDEQKIIPFFDMLEIGHKHAQEENLDFVSMCKAIDPDDLLTLIYTSGTTGEPKGVMLTHKNLSKNIEASLTSIQILSDDTLLSFLPLSHSMERMAGHFLAFSNGATVYYAESIEKVGPNLMETKPTVMLGAPRFYEKVYNRVIASVESSPKLRQKIFWWAMAQGEAMLKHKMEGTKPSGMLVKKHGLANKLVFGKMRDRVGGRIRFFVSGSAPLSADIAKFFAMMGMVVLEGYGLTETSPVLTVNKLDHFKFGKVGPAIPNVEIKIADDGEILAKGPNIMKGYFKDQAATDEVFKDGWFHTGDIGDLDEDGFLKITDRKKSILVTSGGKNVAPAPLEVALILSPFIEQVLIIGDKRNFISALIVPSFEKLEAFAEENDIADRSHSALIKNPEIIATIEADVAKAMEAFSKHERVREIRLLHRELTIERGEMTPTLKLKRKVVLERFSDVVESIYAGAMAEKKRN